MCRGLFRIGRNDYAGPELALREEPPMTRTKHARNVILIALLGVVAVAAVLTTLLA